MKKISWINTKPVGQNNRRRLDQIMLRDGQTGLYQEEYFNELLALEEMRCEGRKDPVFLMLADLSAFVDVSERQKIAKSTMDALSEATRDTDVKGWHVDGLVMGIMFTEMTSKEATSPFAHVVIKCVGCLGSYLGSERLSRIQISWQSLRSGHIFGIQKKGRVLNEQSDSFRNDLKTEPSNLDRARLEVLRRVYNKVQTDHN